MTHLRPEIIRVFTASKGKEILRPGTVGAAEVVASFTREMNSVLILNDGPNSVYVDFDEIVTTATGALVPAKSWWTGDVPITAIHLICAANQTAAIYIVGFLLA